MYVENMNCITCGSEKITESQTATLRECGDKFIVIKNIPCYKCESCGEIILRGDVCDILSEIVEREKERLKDEVKVVNYEPVA